jgi:hypothetical protein
MLKLGQERERFPLPQLERRTLGNSSRSNAQARIVRDAKAANGERRSWGGDRVRIRRSRGKDDAINLRVLRN